MYQPSGSPFTGLAKVILTLVVFGAIAGGAVIKLFSVSGRADLAAQNSPISSASMETAPGSEIQMQKDFHDYELYQTAQAGSLQATQDHLHLQATVDREDAQQQLRFQEEQQERIMESQRLNEYALIGVSTLLAICTGIAILRWGLRAGHRPTAARPPAQAPHLSGMALSELYPAASRRSAPAWPVLRPEGGWKSGTVSVDPGGGKEVVDAS